MFERGRQSLDEHGQIHAPRQTQLWLADPFDRRIVFYHAVNSTITRVRCQISAAASSRARRGRLSAMRGPRTPITYHAPAPIATAGNTRAQAARLAFIRGSMKNVLRYSKQATTMKFTIPSGSMTFQASAMS